MLQVYNSHIIQKYNIDQVYDYPICDCQVQITDELINHIIEILKFVNANNNTNNNDTINKDVNVDNGNIGIDALKSKIKKEENKNHNKNELNININNMLEKRGGRK